MGRGRLFGVKRMMGAVAAKFGRCPRCMRQSFAIAVVAWVFSFTAYAMARPVLATAFGILALGLSGLWLAHLATFASRAAVNVEGKADGPPNEPASIRTSVHSTMPRRRFFRTFAKAFAFAAIATAVSTRAALACVQPPIACTQNSDCTCSGCCGDMGGIHLCQPSC